VKKIGSFLTAAALIAAMLGCSAAVTQYNLTISSTTGGSVTTPGEGTSTYDEVTLVSLVAETEEGYRFVNWTGDVGTIGNVDDATTTITMNDDYSITANFVAVVYTLTVSSTAGGSVITPGVETSTYDEGTVVNLVASPRPGYRFVSWTGDVGTIANVNAASTTITMDAHYTVSANFAQIAPMVAAGWYHTVGVKSDGTVIAVGRNGEGQCNIGGWADITQVAAGFEHTVGLKSNGTVVAVGRNREGQCNIGNWTDIVQVAAGDDHTVGVQSNGTVVAMGQNSEGQCDVGNWTDIVQVAACGDHTVGLKSNGTVVAAGENRYGQGNVGNWTDIVQVAAGYYCTVGLKSNGTVVAVGSNGYGECNVDNWTDITQVAGGPGYGRHTVGLNSDGTVVAVGRNDYGQCNVGGWTDITQVAAGAIHTVGLKFDGTVVAVGSNGAGQCDIGGWHLT